MDKTKNFKIARLEENSRCVILVDGKQITEEYEDIEGPDKDGLFLVRKELLPDKKEALFSLDGNNFVQVSNDYADIDSVGDGGFRCATVVSEGILHGCIVHHEMVLLKDSKRISDRYKYISKDCITYTETSNMDTTEIFMKLIKEDPYTIVTIKNAGFDVTEEMILEAVKLDYTVIDCIVCEAGIIPSEEVILRVIKEDWNKALFFIKNGTELSEKAKKETFKQIDRIMRELALW